MSWAEAIIYEDEDEEALKARFVELSATYPTYTYMEIAPVVFRGLRDVEMRAVQACSVWSRDLDVLERIRLRRINGKEETALTKEQWKAQILSATQDSQLSSQDKKAKLEGLRLYGETEGWIVKAIDKKVENTTKRQRPTFVIAQYEDE